MINAVNASEPQKMWEKTWGDDDSNALFLSVSSYEKNYYYVGGIKTKDPLIFSSDVTPISLLDIKKDNPILNARFSYYPTIIKYDKDGKLKSSKKLTSDSSNAFTSTVKLTIDNLGNYVVNYYYGDTFYTRRYNSDLKLIDGIIPTDKKLYFGYDYDKNNNFIFVGGQETKKRSIYDDVNLCKLL